MIGLIQIIFKKRKYLSIALWAAIIFGALTYYLTVVNVYHSDIFIFAEMNGVGFTLATLFLGLLIALMFGVYLALFAFKRDLAKTGGLDDKAAGAGGAAAGILASGCPSCGVPLLGLIGFPLALYSLPFKGLEIKVLSLAFLNLGIWLVLKSIKKSLVCGINLKV